MELGRCEHCLEGKTASRMLISTGRYAAVVATASGDVAVGATAPRIRISTVIMVPETRFKTEFFSIFDQLFYGF